MVRPGVVPQLTENRRADEVHMQEFQSARSILAFVRKEIHPEGSEMHRRIFLGSGAAAATFPLRCFGGVLGSGDNAALGDHAESISLWPGTPPGGAGLTLPTARVEARVPSTLTPVDRSIDQVGIPLLDIFRPARPDGSALVIAPGGSYRHEVFDLEGTDVARHFNTQGVTCFVLRYRLPGEGWANRSDVPLQDAQRALRLVRANAARYGVDAARIGFMGFSAGGHLACSIATRFDAQVYTPLDATDTLSARPDFCAPLYPVVTMGPGAHASSRNTLLGPEPSADRLDA